MTGWGIGMRAQLGTVLRAYVETSWVQIGAREYVGIRKIKLKMYLEQDYNSKNYPTKSRWFGLFLFIFISSGLVQADEDKPPPGVVGKRYKHVCPEGTERVGEGPPGTTMVFCRQDLGDTSRLEGDYTAFYLNGNKRVQGEYVTGKRHGTWVQYYRTGEVQAIREFQEGKPVEVKQFRKDGVPVKEPKKLTQQKSGNSEVHSKLREATRGKKKAGKRARNLGWPGVKK